MKKLINNLCNIYKKIPVQAKLSLWTFICSCIQKGISIITVPIFTRMLTTEQYGQYSIYLSWINILSIFTSFRLYAGVYNKGLSKFKDDKDSFALSMQYTTTILTALVFAIYLLFHHQINQLTELSTPIMLVMFAELFMTPPMSFWSVKQRYDFKYRSVVVATLGLAILNPLLGVIFVQISVEKGIARIVSAALSQIIFGLIFYTINLINGKFKFNTGYAKYAVKFNVPLLPHYFSEYILNQSDRIMIQKMVGLSAAGIYSVAYSAGMLLTIISGSINQALVPWLYQELDRKEYVNIRKTITSIAFLILIPLSLFMAFSPEIVLILAGNEYADAVRVMAPITASIFFLFLYTLFANVEFYYEKNKFTMYISFIGAAVNVILNYIFIPMVGFWAAGFTTFISYGVYCLGHFLFMSKIFRDNEGCDLFRKRDIFGLSFLLVVIMMVFYMINDFALLRYAIVAGLIILFVVKRRQIQFLISSTKKKK